MSKLLTVFGATGNQGGSVIRAVLADPVLSKQFKIRGITRDVSKPAAQALASKGVQVAAADMSSKASLVDAVKDSHTVFLVTAPNFLAGTSEELTHGKNVADAAEQAGVQHLIYSSLLHVADTTQGRLKNVPHFDDKANVEKYIRAKTSLPSTFVLPGYFMNNYTARKMLPKGADGVYTLAYPVSEKAAFPLFDVEDTGKYVVAAIKNRDKVLGQQILAAEDYYTPSRLLSEFEQVTGNKARFVSVDADTYKSFLPPSVAEEMLENHLFIDEPGYFNGQSLESSTALLASVGLKPTTWKEFLEQHKAAFQVTVEGVGEWSKE